SVRNPLPARGGIDPESLEHVRQSAPVAFRTLERAVTPDDYATVAERHPEVQRAQATVRWTGPSRTVLLTIDRLGGRPPDAPSQRLGVPSPAALEAGVLPVGRLEIVRLDSDPSFPERGVLRLTLKGGR